MKKKRLCVLCASNERSERAVRKGVIQHSQGRPPDSLIVDDAVIIENKTVDKIAPIHEAHDLS